MREFDPAQPAILHDRRGNRMVPWTGEQAGTWKRRAVYQSDGLVEWDGILIDGWAEALGG